MEDVKVQSSSQQLYVASFGRGVWRIPLVSGTAPYNKQAYDDLGALSNTVRGMGLSAGVTTQLTNQIAAIRTSLRNGNGVCPDLSSLEAQIADLVTKGKVSAAQQSQLDSAIDAIRGELGC
jgi:hypothetical protein